jgi:hypothetical protein
MRSLRTMTFALVGVLALCSSAAGLSNAHFRTKHSEVTVIRPVGSAANARAVVATSDGGQGAVRADHRGWHHAAIKSRPGSKRHHAVRRHLGPKLVRAESGDGTQAINTTGTAQTIQAPHTQSTENDDNGDDSADHHGTANDDDNGTDDTESSDDDGDGGTGDDVEGDDNSDCAGGSGDDVEGDHQSDCDDDQGDSNGGGDGGDGGDGE